MKNHTKIKRKKSLSFSIIVSIEKIRLSVFRSNKEIYVQLIDDTVGKTLIGISQKAIKIKGTKTEKAKAVGRLLAEKAKEQKISKVIFDKGAYKFHGRVKAVAEGAREGGLTF
jgi:large subunit ribosomal protein L18